MLKALTGELGRTALVEQLDQAGAGVTAALQRLLEPDPSARGGAGATQVP